MAFKLASKSSKQADKETRAEEGRGLHIPFLSSLPFKAQLRILGFGLLIFLVVGAVAAYLDNRTAALGTRYVAQSSKLLMLSQRLAKDALQALNGNSKAFDDMDTSRKQMASVLRLLDKGDATLPATSGPPRQLLDPLLKLAQETEANVQAVVAGRPGLVTVRVAINASDITNREMRPVLQQMIAGMTGINQQRAVRLALLIERIAKDASIMLGEVAPAQIAELGKDTEDAEALLAALPAADPAVIRVGSLFEDERVSIEAIIGNAQGLLGAKKAGREIFEDSDLILLEAQKLTSEYQAALSGRITSFVMMLSGGMLLLLLLLLSKGYLDESRRQTREAELANRRNQQAILLLMNEMADLADGDLTVKATVTDEITGAIADAVNYTTEELRKLVAFRKVPRITLLIILESVSFTPRHCMQK